MSEKEIPDVVLVLLAICLDPSTSSALQGEIVTALDTICHSIADPNVVAELVRPLTRRLP